MKNECKRDRQNIWLIFSGAELPEPEGYVLRMLSENRVPGLLPCRITRVDAETKLHFNISSVISFTDFMETFGVSRRLLEEFLKSVLNICECLEDYLLPVEGLLLDPGKMYVEQNRFEFLFCYVPGEDRNYNEQMQSLSGMILPYLDREDRSAVVTGYQLYQQCMSGETEPDDLKKLLFRKELSFSEPEPVTKEELERSALLDEFFRDPDEEELTDRIFGRIRDRLSKKKRKDNIQEKKNCSEADRRNSRSPEKMKYGMEHTPVSDGGSGRKQRRKRNEKKNSMKRDPGYEKENRTDYVEGSRTDHRAGSRTD
ncbi:MAG: hypothetical protein HUJ73_05480, partial [Eubacterium sp.]|nr:hypothetical protein [Eubacterium sp.]